MAKIAVILSGCGHLDGSEIREAVITLLALDKHHAEVTCFAPNIEQRDVVNHLTGEPCQETRNVLVESARIARGAVTDLQELYVEAFDAVIIPGGYGAAKNLSSLAVEGPNCQVIPAFQKVIDACIATQKPIGVICISPAVLITSLQQKVKATVTIGDDGDNLIETLGGVHTTCATSDIVIDEQNRIVSCSAYMREDSLSHVAEGIEKLVAKVIELCNAK